MKYRVVVIAMSAEHEFGVSIMVNGKTMISATYPYKGNNYYEKVQYFNQLAFYIAASYEFIGLEAVAITL